MEVNLDGHANGDSEVCVSFEVSAEEAEAFLKRAESVSHNSVKAPPQPSAKALKDSASSKKGKSPEVKTSGKAAELASTSASNSVAKAAKEEKKSPPPKGKGTTLKKDVAKKAIPKGKPGKARGVGLRKTKKLEVSLEIPVKVLQKMDSDEDEDDEDDDEDDEDDEDGETESNALNAPPPKKVEQAPEKNRTGKKKPTQTEKGAKISSIEIKDSKAKESEANIQNSSSTTMEKDLKVTKKEEQPQAESCSNEEQLKTPAKIITQRKSRKSPIQTRPAYDDMTLEPEFLGEEEVDEQPTVPVQKSSKGSKNQKNKQGKKKETTPKAKEEKPKKDTNEDQGKKKEAPQKSKEEKPKKDNSEEQGKKKETAQKLKEEKPKKDTNDEGAASKEADDAKKEDTNSEAPTESVNKTSKNAKKTKAVTEKKEASKKQEEKPKPKSEAEGGMSPKSEEKTVKGMSKKIQTPVATNSQDDSNALEIVTEKEEEKPKPETPADKQKKVTKNAKNTKAVTEEKKKEAAKKPKPKNEEDAMDEEEQVPAKMTKEATIAQEQKSETKSDAPAKKQNPKRKQANDGTENEKKRARVSGAAENKKDDEDPTSVEMNEVGEKKTRANVNGKKKAPPQAAAVAANNDQPKPSTSKRKMTPPTQLKKEEPAPPAVEERTGDLPRGWRREIVVRKSGKTVGKADVYIYSPDGRKHRSRNDVKRYLDSNQSSYPNIKAEDFDFSGNIVAMKNSVASTSTAATENIVQTEQQKPAKSSKKTPSPKKNNKESGKKVLIKMFASSKNAGKK